MPLPEPQLIDAEERQLVALSRDFTMATRNEIPAMWNDFWGRGWALPGTVDEACFGVSHSVFPDGRFSYAIGLHAEPVPADLPEGACLVTLSAGRYAMFRETGPVQQIPQMFDAIFTEWLPNSGHAQREGADGVAPNTSNVVNPQFAVERTLRAWRVVPTLGSLKPRRDDFGTTNRKRTLAKWTGVSFVVSCVNSEASPWTLPLCVVASEAFQAMR